MEGEDQNSGCVYSISHGSGDDLYVINQAPKDQKRFPVEAFRAVARILGHAMAHEIGHVLLGSNGHSLTGLMRADWDKGDWQRVAVAHLAINPEEVVRMRRNLAAGVR